MIVESLSNECWNLTNPTNYATNGYPTRIPTITKPSGAGVIAMGDGGSICPQWIRFLPLGTGANDTTFLMKVLLWKPTRLAPGVPLWIPEVLGEWTCTLGTSVGVAGSDLAAAQTFCDTITMTGGPTFVTTGAPPIVEKWFQVSPLADQIGSITVPSLGARLVEAIYSTGGVATDCNALYTKL